MARERMVTRTIKSAVVEVMTIDTMSAEVKVIPYMTEPQEKDEKYLKVLQKEHETETFKIVKVESVEIYENLYGMTEKEFKQYAEILPSR